MTEGEWSTILTKIKDLLWPERKLDIYRSEHDALEKYLQEDLLNTDKILHLRKAQVSSVLTPLLNKYLENIEKSHDIEGINIYAIGKRGSQSYPDDKWRKFLSELISDYPFVKVIYIFSFTDNLNKNDIWSEFKDELDKTIDNDSKLKYIDLFNINKDLARFYTDYHVLIIEIDATKNKSTKIFKTMWIEKEHIKINEANHVEFHPHNALMLRDESIKKYQSNMQRIYEIISLASQDKDKTKETIEGHIE